MYQTPGKMKKTLTSPIIYSFEGQAGNFTYCNNWLKGVMYKGQLEQEHRLCRFQRLSKVFVVHPLTTHGA